MDKQLKISVEDLKRAEDFWFKNISELVEPVILVSDVVKTSEECTNLSSVQLNDELSLALNKICANNDMALFIYYTSIIYAFLYKYSCEKDIAIWAPILNNNFKEYNNVIVLRTKIDPEWSFRKLLNEIKINIKGAYENEFFSILKSYKIDSSYLSDSISKIAVLSESFHNENNLNELDFSLNLVFKVSKSNSNVNSKILFNSNFFSYDYINKMNNSLVTISKQVIKNVDIKIKDIQLIEPDELIQITTKNNDNNLKDIKDFFSWFEIVKNKYSDKVAIEYESKNITYKELYELSYQNAIKLNKLGILQNEVIAIIADNSLELIINILSIIRIGAIFLPINSKTPIKRIHKILKDSCASIIITEKGLKDEFKEYKLLLIEDLLVSLNENNEGKFEVNVNCNNPLYLIYTSGSTGSSKGVLIRQQGVINYTNWRIRNYQIKESDVTLEPLSFAFDGFYSNLFSSLFSGGKLVLLKNSKQLDPLYIIDIISKKEVSNVSLVPGMFKMIIDNAEKNDLRSLRFVVLAGEKSASELISQIQRKLKKLKLINEYGPTESSIAATVKIDFINNTNDIGFPISGTNVFIVNKNYEILPVEFPGEMCLSGIGLADGYINSVELTHDKFVNGTFNKEERIYCTGDIAKLTSKGNLEFIGRSDHIVKIRGNRVSLLEIERGILEFNSISKAIVIDLNDKNDEKYLCGYFTSNVEVDLSELRNFLQSYLPDYMIPTSFVQLKEFPLTFNGKINVKELPIPKTDHNRIYVAPRNHVEKKIINIWAEVLDKTKDEIGILDNFFELGGHSIKATIILLRIQKEFGEKIPVSTFFNNPTVSATYNFLKQNGSQNLINIPPVEKKKYYKLSSAQKRLYFIQQMYKEGTSYNITQVVPLTKTYDIENLKKITDFLIKRHEGLRTAIININDEPYQRIFNEIDFQIETIDVDENNVNKVAKNFIRPFDLSSFPLFRIGLINILDSGKKLLIFDIHHILTDGISQNIIFREISKLLKGESLPDIRATYKDYSEWQYKVFNNKEILKQKEFWSNVFEKKISRLKLPYLKSDNQITNFSRGRIRFTINQEITEKFKTYAIKNNMTLYSVMLAVYVVWLSKITDQDDIIIGLTTSGREYYELENIVGIFINTLAFRTYPIKDKTFSTYLNEVKHSVLKVFENQDVQFEEIVKDKVVVRHSNANPIFDVAFGFWKDEFKREENENEEVLSSFNIDQDAKFRLLLMVYENNNNLEFSFEFIESLFDKNTLTQIIGYLKTILSNISSNFSQQIQQIEFLTADEKMNLLSGVNLNGDSLTAEFNV